jgi:hypothetical protein
MNQLARDGSNNCFYVHAKVVPSPIRRP